MLKIILNIIKNPSTGIFLFFLYFIGVPFLILNYLSITEIFIIDFLIILISILFITEIFFIFVYKVYNGIYFQFIKKIPFEKLYVEPHPYLPYMYKKNFSSAPAERYNYPLHKNFYSAKLKTNNLGFYNGVNGDRDVIVPKPIDTFRIACLGARPQQIIFLMEKIIILIH